MKPKLISKKRHLPAKTKSDAKPLHTDDFLIVAVGASAGGIEAFNELVRNLPPDTGMAFVLVQHLDPTHHSMLADLISKITPMRVNEVTNGMLVEPNNVYVIPPNTTMSISHHTLQLVPRDDSAGMRDAHRSLHEVSLRDGESRRWRYPLRLGIGWDTGTLRNSGARRRDLRSRFGNRQI